MRFLVDYGICMGTCMGRGGTGVDELYEIVGNDTRLQRMSAVHSECLRESVK